MQPSQLNENKEVAVMVAFSKGIGFEVSLLGVVLALYVGDIYLRIPHVIEVAHNSTGFYINRA